MKKIAIVVAAAVLVMVLAGCAAGASSSAASASASADASSTASASASATAASSESASESSAAVGIANPWHEAASAGEAATGAGLDSFTVPDTVTVNKVEFFDPAFTYMEGVAQVEYNGGAAGLMIRKGTGVADQTFTGDYTDYEIEWTQGVNNMAITCKGHETGIINLATWEADGNAYAIYCMGLGGENFGIEEGALAEIVMTIS